MSTDPVLVVSPPEPLPPSPPLPQTLVCDNCHVALAGEYCSACGQRHEPHVHTLRHFASEAFESLSHADSRLWRTLLYLFSRPGYLTKEFFAGRRVSYLPPFRLYLVISVLFFLVVGVPKGDFVRLDPQDAEQTKTLEETAKTVESLDLGAEKKAAQQAVAERLRQKAKAVEADATQSVDATPSDAKPAPAKAEKDTGFDDGVRDFCDSFSVEWGGKDNARRSNIRQSCRKMADDGGREFGAKLVHNLPRAMFVFLPLLALIMKAMYWRPKRYYVEHLLFLVHNHAFVFLTVLVLMLIDRIPRVADYTGIVWFAAFLYMVWYLFRGMRNYYGQSRKLTTAKYFTLGIAYYSTSFVVLLLTALFSAMTA